MGKETKIPDATIERISLYSRPLERLLDERTQLVSSERLAELCKVNPAQVRKDFSYFGGFGVRGVGYDVRDLLGAVKRILVSDREWRLGIIGLGNLGKALVENENFKKRGYRFTAAFDTDPEKIGQRLPSGLVIEPVTKLKAVKQELGIEIGVIATPPSHAWRVADSLVDAGIRGILNFSPIQVRQPEDCLVVNVDFTVSLENLAYRLSRIKKDLF